MLTIIGCGNSNRSDDGAGIYVAQQLQRLKEVCSDDVRIYDAGTGGMDVMFQARGSDALIIIDASQSGSEAGSIFEVPGESLEACPEPSFGLHDFRWQHALYAGRKMFKDDFPKEVTVYLIEAANLSLGLELSEAVKNAADRLVDKILQRLERLNAGEPQQGQQADTSQQTVRIQCGNVYLDHVLCRRFFQGIESVALLKRESGFLVMPVFNQASGGRLLKIRNLAGDRVVTATDFLQDCGIQDDAERTCPVTWDSTAAGLYVDLRLTRLDS